MFGNLGGFLCSAGWSKKIPGGFVPCFGSKRVFRGDLFHVCGLFLIQDSGTVAFGVLNETGVDLIHVTAQGTVFCSCYQNMRSHVSMYTCTMAKFLSTVNQLYLFEMCDLADLCSPGGRLMADFT